MSSTRRYSALRLAFVFIAIALATSSGLVLSAPAMQSTEDAASQIDTFLNNLVEKDLFSGSVLVARDGEVLLSEGYGLANREWDIPNTPQTKFRIGSITKQFTAMAILILQERGSLSVQDKICTYIEDCPDHWQDITIHHLLTHTSGIPDPDPGAVPVALPKSPDSLIEIVRDKPLRFQPGEGYDFSNYGYIVLGRIITLVSDDSYQKFLEENIFDPLGMTNTGYDRYTEVIKNRAEGYGRANQKAAYIDMSIPYAAGGLYSTVEDLYVWTQALHSGRVVSQETLDAAFAASVRIPEASPEDEAIYSYGLWIIKWDGHRAIGHRGGIVGIEGFRTILVYFPDNKVTVVVLSNLEAAEPDTVVDVVLSKLSSES